MDKSTLETMIANGFSQREIGKATGLGQTTVRYWLKSFDLSTMSRSKRRVSRGCVCKCGESRTEKFYGRSKGICGNCHNTYTKDRGRINREKAIAHLGGKCSNKECGFSKWLCSLDIHHLDPKKKDKNWTSMRGWSWRRIEKEIDSCVLLCRNCHGAVHSGELDIGV